MQLNGKVAIVTGAASGIGEATAKLLAQEGATVVIADMNYDGATRVAQGITSSGGKALALRVDVSSESDVEQMVEKILTEFGQVDILINNAASLSTITWNQPFHETHLPDWMPGVNITFLGVLLCCRAVIPHMLKRKSGRIVNVSSESGKSGTAYAAVYSGCKAGVAGFSRAIALELASSGITVNCVSPGPVATPALAEFKRENPVMYQKQVIANIPMRRDGQPEEIASAILFLASEGSSYITGQDLSVDGGVRM